MTSQNVCQEICFDPYVNRNTGQREWTLNTVGQNNVVKIDQMMKTCTTGEDHHLYRVTYEDESWVFRNTVFSAAYGLHPDVQATAK